MRYSQFPGRQARHWVEAGEARGCDSDLLTLTSFLSASWRKPDGLDQDDTVRPGGRDAAPGAGGATGALPEGVRAQAGRREREHRVDPHADPRGAASRLRHVRGADVAVA